MDVWIVYNPSPNATGCPHPRPGEGRKDLQLDGFEYAVMTQEEMDLWRLSPGFRDLDAAGYVTISKATTDNLPPRKVQIPKDLEPEPYEAAVAFQVALAPEETDDVQLARINLFRDGSGDRLWVEEANMGYLKTRHRKMLGAARWYMENFGDKKSSSYRRRLRDINRQIKAIDAST